ncbi:MAG: hypothetical protein JXR51_04445 [Bacteroidales bacterium]|nr:hypothetical protein [Bacteroidales bacterium]
MIKNIISHFVLFSGLLFLVSNCTGIYEDGNELSNDVKNRIKQISVDDLKAKIENQEDFLLIDVRQTSEYKKGSIEGAFSVPRGILETEIASTEFWEQEFVDPPADTTQIIIFCAKGARGALAVESLMKLGYKNVKNLDGGYSAFNPNPQATENHASEGGCGG